MVVKQVSNIRSPCYCLRVVLSHMVVKLTNIEELNDMGLRVVLSHMVVKLNWYTISSVRSLRVVLSHMVVKPERAVNSC